MDKTKAEKVVELLSASMAGISLYYVTIQIFYGEVDNDLLKLIAMLLTGCLTIFTITVFWLKAKQMMNISAIATIGLLIVWVICFIIYIIRKF